jgi:CRISPR-associated protein Csd1
MILQALCDYYIRTKDSGGNIAPEGFENKEIPFIIVLDENGEVINIERTYEETGKAKKAKEFLVPHSVKKTSGIKSNLLWDNVEYVLGIETESNFNTDKKKNQYKEKVNKRHAAFKEEIDSLGDIDDKGIKALKLFLNNDNKEKVLQAKFNQQFEQLKDENPYIAFRMQGENCLISQSDKVKERIENQNHSKDISKQSICLISGKKDDIESLHSAIKGVRGAQSMGANIVSFNAKAFCSYGKEQGTNAPCGKQAVFSYTTALNSLLRKDSKQKIQIGDATTVFWSQKQCVFENNFSSFFNIPPKDNPDKGIVAVKALFDSVRNGVPNPDYGNMQFFILGLSPNASRISIRFFIKDTVRGMSENIAKHFDDLKIVRPSFEREFLPLFKLLVSTAVQGKAENISPHLSGDFMMSILRGLPYPTTLLQAAINRIKAEQKIDYPKAALIKAYLNRAAKYKNQKEELTMDLNKENTNQGYVLGRLFATFERQQEKSLGKTNSTIMRYYGSASSAPISVFPNLMRLQKHHHEKIRKENPGLAVIYDKLVTEITSKLDDKKGFPAHLSLSEQGMFAIGYYQQKQDLFERKTKEQGEQK